MLVIAEQQAQQAGRRAGGGHRGKKLRTDYYAASCQAALISGSVSVSCWAFLCAGHDATGS